MKELVKKTVFGSIDIMYGMLGAVQKKSNWKLPNENISSLIGEKELEHIATKRSDFGVAVYDYETKNWHTYGENKEFQCNSTVKVSVALAALYDARQKETPLSDEEQQKMKKMITLSDNETTSYFWKKVGSEDFMQSFYNMIGLGETKAGTNGYWGFTTTTPKNQVQLLHVLEEENEWFTQEEREYVLSLMKQVVPSQSWGVSAGTKPDQTALKNGWARNSWNNWNVHSIGIVHNQQTKYAIAIYTKSSPTQNWGIRTIEFLSERIQSQLSSSIKHKQK